MSPNNTSTTSKSGEAQSGCNCRYDGSGEQALVAAAQAGITGAMNELLARHKTVLYRAARRFTTSHEDAEELVQDAMLRAFVNVGKFRKECRFGTWLIAIVNNAALSMKRKRGNAYFVSLDSKDEEAVGPGRWDIPDIRLNPEEETMQKELLAFLHELLLRQSKTHQVILQWCLSDGVCISDAALALGLTIGSAKSSLYRARRRLSDSFEQRGLVKRHENLQTTRAR